MATHHRPDGYEEKFAGFLQLIERSKATSTTSVIVAQPWVIGDTYAEVMESLSLLAKAGLSLHITSQQ